MNEVTGVTYLLGRVLQASLSSSSDGGRDEACEKPSSSEL